MNDVIHFYFGSNEAKFESSNKGENLIKNALVLVEGIHKDNKGRTHDFPEERVLQTVLNTNKKIKEGEPIPLKIDHNPSVDADIGEVVENLVLLPKLK